jgi:hypothetical protein
MEVTGEFDAPAALRREKAPWFPASVDPTSNLDVAERKNFYSCRETNHDTSAAKQTAVIPTA